MSLQPGYSVQLKERFHGAQRKRPASAIRNYRDNFDRIFGISATTEGKESAEDGLSGAPSEHSAMAVEGAL